MEIIFQILSFACALASFIIAILLSRSNIRFTKGELYEIIKNFILGTIFLFGAMNAQFIAELPGFGRSVMDLVKYFFMLEALFFYLLATLKIHKMSKVLGFASEEIPKRLKKVLKS